MKLYVFSKESIENAARTLGQDSSRRLINSNRRDLPRKSSEEIREAFRLASIKISQSHS